MRQPAAQRCLHRGQQLPLDHRCGGKRFTTGECGKTGEVGEIERVEHAAAGDHLPVGARHHTGWADIRAFFVICFIESSPDVSGHLRTLTPAVRYAANLTGIELGKHLIKDGEVHRCQFSIAGIREEKGAGISCIKTRKVWLNQYLSLDRSLLPRAENATFAWISIRSTPLPDNSIHYQVKHVTKKLAAVSLNPYRFRDSVAVRQSRVSGQSPGLACLTAPSAHPHRMVIAFEVDQAFAAGAG